MNPHIINLHLEGHREKLIMRDEEMWRFGIYIREALKSTVCNGFVWKNKGQAPDEYPKEPFLQNGIIRSQEPTEDEMQREVDRFFAQESARRANWKRKRKRQEKAQE